MNEYWFRQHRYGVGASPSTWEGWAVLLVYVAGVIGLNDWFKRHHHPLDGSYYLYLALMSLALIFIAWLKTKGGWRWRWGDPD